MLDSLLIAQATLNGLHVIEAMVIVLVVLWIGAAYGLFFLMRPRVTGKVGRLLRILSKAFIYLTLIYSLALAGFLIYAFIPSPPEKHEWTLDFNESPDLAPFKKEKCTNWQGSLKAHQDCIHEGQININFGFTGGRRFIGEGKVLWASGLNGKLSSIHFFENPRSAEEVKQISVKILSDWGLNIDDFKEIENYNNRRKYFFPPDEKRTNPWLELSVLSLENPQDSSKPWALTYKWHWLE